MASGQATTFQISSYAFTVTISGTLPPAAAPRLLSTPTSTVSGEEITSAYNLSIKPVSGPACGTYSESEIIYLRSALVAPQVPSTLRD